MYCPYCKKEAKTTRGMIKHLTGTFKYGGHELPQKEAEVLAKEAQSAPRSIELDPSPHLVKNAQSAPRSIELDRSPRFVKEIDSSSDFLTDFFQSLAQNKVLPKYQFERRVDAIIALFLPEIFSEIFGWKITVVVPEFPIKKPNNNQTTNADYALFRHGNSSKDIEPAWILFELKTDSASIKESQLSFYLDAQKKGMKILRDELNEVFKHTQHKEKYKCLFKKIDHHPLNAPIEIVYLLPDASKLLNSEGVHRLTFGDLESLTLCRYPEAWNLFQKEFLPLFHI